MSVIRERYIRPSAMIAARKLGDEMVIMSAVDSTLFTLNEVATAIWQAADGSTPLQSIVEEQVCGTFEVDLSTALADADELVEQLAAHKILEISEQPFSEEVR